MTELPQHSQLSAAQKPLKIEFVSWSQPGDKSGTVTILNEHDASIMQVTAEQVVDALRASSYLESFTHIARAALTADERATDRHPIGVALEKLARIEHNRDKSIRAMEQAASQAASQQLETMFTWQNLWIFVALAAFFVAMGWWVL